MALHSVPLYPGGDQLGSGSRATTARTHQRISRKDERGWTTDTYAPYDDGRQWRKYGEKKLSNSNFPRFYYRCTYKNEMKCAATKQVQQKDTSDPPLFSVTYFNHHTCSSTSSNPTMGSTCRDGDAAQSSSSKKAVSICFSPNSSSSSQQPRRAFLTFAATTTPPSSRSSKQPYSRGNDQQQQLVDRSAACASQFQWTTGISSTNGTVKMEVDSYFSEASGRSSSSSSTGGALSRTLLPIGQSRCIEYFHFL